MHASGWFQSEMTWGFRGAILKIKPLVLSAEAIVAPVDGIGGQ